MKILLVALNAKYVHSNLAIKYLYAAAAEGRASIETREFTINQDEDLIYTEIMRCAPNVAAFSCYIWNIRQVLDLADTLKKARPELKILLGGPEVTHRAEEILRDYPAIDMILVGEGEQRFRKLLRVFFEEAGELDQFHDEDSDAISEFEKALGYYGIDGLLFRDNGRIVTNSPAEAVDMAKVPFPYHHLPCEDDKIIYYESSRGCPYRCTYCLSCLDKKVRALPVDRVKQELRYFLYKGVKQVKFVDRTFNFDRNRAYEIFQYLIESDNHLTNFHFELCGDLIDEELIKLLERARSGLFQFEIGVQSTNSETIQAIERQADFWKLAEGVRAIRKKGNIHLHLDLIAGLPFENHASFRKSFNDVYALKPHHLQLGFLKLLPGTPIREQAKEHGYVYRESPPYEVIANRYLSAVELVRFKMIEAVLERYYNRGGFANLLEFATQELCSSAFDFYEDFSVFYYRNGYQNQSQSKENLYRIMNRYAERKDKTIPGVADRMRELLESDLTRSMNPEAVKRFNKQGWEL